MVAMINSFSLMRSLGNTAMAWHQLRTIQSQFSNNFVLEKQDLEGLFPPGRTFLEMSALRHPEPRLAAEAKVTCPDLQVLGSWEKLSVSGRGLNARQGDAYFVWNSKSCVVWLQRILLTCSIQAACTFLVVTSNRVRVPSTATSTISTSTNSTAGIRFHHSQTSRLPAKAGCRNTVCT